MSAPTPRSRRIQVLRDEVSRKIAAGEVIDRPFSIVRELIDNALDAGARAVDVYLEGGGITRVRVVDDGAGMDADDLRLSWQPHATSKIESEDDLLTVSSLGFRGEALSSMAVCSRLVMTSCTGDGEPARRLEVHGGRLASLEPSQGRKGSIVDVSELFFNYPARKKFLRSASAESGLCKSILIDRAVTHPDVAFRFFTDGGLRLSLPVANLVERIALAYGGLVDARLLEEASEKGDGFTVRVVAGGPDLRRRDRRLLQSFVNRRRVTEFSLLQAAEYGFSGYIPGGWHPVAFVLVDVDPSLVDFNIHPAKKEVRFRNLPDVHKAVVAAVRKLLAPSGAAAAESPRARPAASPVAEMPRLDLSVVSREGQSFTLPPRAAASPEPEGTDGLRFIGQVFGVFLIFELPGRLLVLDQHAAHERIIFERLAARAQAKQELLFPVGFDVSVEEEGRLLEGREELDAMGISLQPVGGRTVEVTALCEDFRALPAERLVELLRGVGGGQWQRTLRATAACRLAIKEGEAVDPVTALELCRQALRLPVPRCPHGRPIWHEVAEETLLSWVDRPDKK